jgi:hypothetical protein
LNEEENNIPIYNINNTSIIGYINKDLADIYNKDYIEATGYFPNLFTNLKVTLYNKLNKSLIKAMLTTSSNE